MVRLNWTLTKGEMKKLYNIICSETFCLSLVCLSFLSLIATIVLFIFYSEWTWSNIIDEEKLGQFGDFTGGLIGTLLAFTASLLYFIALKEQQKDVRTNQKSLDSQIEEFRNQVSELQESRRVSEKQLDAMSLQQFENHFYAYFSIYQKVKDFIYSSNGGNITITDFLEKLNDEIKNNALRKQTESKGYLITKKSYEKLFVMYRNQFAHYFRTLYRLVEIVVSCCAPKLDDRTKMKYIKIIRSQLSDSELLLIHYNCMSDYAENSRNLFYEYNLMKHLSPVHKYEIQNRCALKPKEIVIMEKFVDSCKPFIINFINRICASPDTQNAEREYPLLNIILKEEYIDNVQFKLIFKSPNATTKKIGDLFLHVLYDLLFFSHYKIDVDDYITHVTYCELDTKYECHSYILSETDIVKFIIDKDDE